MELKLYNNTSDMRCLNKSITLLATMNAVQLTDPVNVENPVFLVDLSDSYIGANYAYCADFGRYYIITGHEVVNGNQMRLSCHVDVRMSFKNQILASSIVADRSTSHADAYVPDSMVTVRDSITTITRVVENNVLVGPSGNNQFVLTIGGK